MRMSKAESRGFEDHRRDREAGRLLYPVLSRRSEGLSLGVNLFPDRKCCSFDCPYCEVFPFPESAPFDTERFGTELESFLGTEWSSSWAPEPIRDICISGSGEPSMSAGLVAAARICAEARARHRELLGHSRLVIITNSTGFLSPSGSRGLAEAQALGFVLWAKLDAGSEEQFRRMSGSGYRFDELVEGIRDYAAIRPITIQTMLCEVGGHRPDERDLADYRSTLMRLVRGGARIEGLQLYTLARPDRSGSCRALPDAELLGHASRLRAALAGEGLKLEVAVYGSRGRLAEGMDRP
ncbi:MAG TPA: hypothetical protein VMC79_11040 [Rectinemataceae bacterium]|nr:hypothetical protein [Rectinemataceae bacterium]